MEKIYHVYTYDTYDDINASLAMCSSLEQADKLIREYIEKCWCFFSTIFYVEEWKLDVRWASNTVKIYSKDDVLKIGKELGVYKEE